MSDLTEKLEKLVADLEVMKFDENGPHIKVVDIHEDFKHVLTPEAAAALEPAIKSTVGVKEWNDTTGCAEGEWVRRVEYTRSVYLSVTGRSPEGIEKAAKLLYEEVNKLAAAGKLRGHLCRLSILRLSEMPSDLARCTFGPGLPATAVFCFPHVPMEEKFEGPYFIEEGGMGVDLEPHLKPEVLSRTTLMEEIQATMAAKRIKAMEECCAETPCFYDDCSKCSAGPR